MNYKVSIIIPSLNSALYIDECIQSVLNQNLKDIEVLCVDANSSDETLQIIQNYAKKDTRLRLIMSDKKSYGYQVNLGINTAQGEYIGIVESDDYIDKRMYQRLYEVAKEKDCEVLSSNLLDFYDECEKRIFTPHLVNPSKKLYHQVLSAKDERVLTQSITMNPGSIFKLSFLKQNQIYHNESLGAAYQDTGFSFKARLFVKRIYFLNEAYYFYRQDNQNSSCNHFTYEKALSVSKEFDLVKKVLEENEHLKTLIPTLSFLRFYGYSFVLSRIEEGALEFCKQIQAEFKELEAKNELDFTLFNKYQSQKLKRIMQNPNEFYENIILKPKGAVQKVENSLEYKLGKELINIKSPLKLITLPFRLKKILKSSSHQPLQEDLDIKNFKDYYEALISLEHLSFLLGEAFLKAYQKNKILSFVPQFFQIYKKHKNKQKLKVR